MGTMMQLEVLTPDKEILDASISAMQVLLPDGWWGILPGHAPMISYIGDCVLHYTIDESKRYIAVYQGTIEVQKRKNKPTRVLMLTAAAEEGDTLEVVVARLEQQAANLAILAKEANLEFNQLRLSLEKSLQEAEITKLGLK